MAAFLLEYIALPVLMLAIGLGFVRLLRGPNTADRVVALDLMTVIGIGVLAVLAMSSNQAVVLDVAIVLALLAFLGTVAFAAYVERRS